MACEPVMSIRGFGTHIYDLNAPLDDVDLDLGWETEAA